MRAFTLFTLACLSLLVSACREAAPISASQVPPADDQIALDTLLEFFGHLHDGRYSEAADLYGGTYKTMIEHNPDLDLEDHAALLQNACTINGAQCLQVRTAVLKNQPSPTEFAFDVEFETKDGSVFVLGPCCGASESDQPSKSVFIVTVIETAEGNFLVLDMPPYLP